MNAIVKRVFASAVAMGMAASGAAAQSPSPVGTWLGETGRSHIRIASCGDKLCGSVAWLKEPLDEAGKPKVDHKNSDDGKRQRPLLGLAMLENFVRSADAAEKWESGTIYNPEDGDTYRSTMTLEDADTLKVRGYVGIPLFGKTQTWTRVKP